MSILTLDQAAAILHVSTRTLRRWRNEGKIRAAQPGRRLLFRTDDIEAMFQTQGVSGAEDSTVSTRNGVVLRLPRFRASRSTDNRGA